MISDENYDTIMFSLCHSNEPDMPAGRIFWIDC